MKGCAQEAFPTPSSKAPFPSGSRWLMFFSFPLLYTVKFDNRGFVLRSNRLRRTKVGRAVMLIALILLSLDRTINATLNKKSFRCYISLLLIRAMYLSIIAKNIFSCTPGDVSFIRFRVDDISCWSRYFFPEELMTSIFFAITDCHV